MSRVDKYVQSVPDVPCLTIGSIFVEITRDGGCTLRNSENVIFFNKEVAEKLAEFFATWYLFEELNNAQ